MALVKLPSRSPLSPNQGLELPKAVFSVSRLSRLKDSLGPLHRLKVSAQVLEAAYSALLVALVASVSLNNPPKPRTYSVANKQRNPRALLECSKILARSEVSNPLRALIYSALKQEALGNHLLSDRHRPSASNSKHNRLLDSSAKLPHNHSSALEAHLEAAVVFSTRLYNNPFSRQWARDCLVSSLNPRRVLRLAVWAQSSSSHLRRKLVSTRIKLNFQHRSSLLVNISNLNSTKAKINRMAELLNRTCN